MIPIETLKKITVIYTHANCPDGLASAMILKDAFRRLWMEPRIEFLVHGTKEHRVAGREVRDGELALFCDIAPSTANDDGAPFLNTAFWASGGKHAIVLDHHKGAEDIVRSFGVDGVFADEKQEPGVSGAVLAWREVWLAVAEYMDFACDRPIQGTHQKAVENFALCVGARDTWQTKDPRFARGQWISKMLMSKPRDYWLGHVPFLDETEEMFGRELFAQHELAVQQAVDQCALYRIESPRLAVRIFQEQTAGFRLTSDVAEELRTKGDECDVVAGFSFIVDKPGDEPKFLVSLRAGVSGFDVARFAKFMGGGGHTAAAGFSVPVEKVENGPYKFIVGCLIRYLSSQQEK